MDACYIGLIIIGILATMLMLLMALFGIAMIIAAPFLGKTYWYNFCCGNSSCYCQLVDDYFKPRKGENNYASYHQT